MSELLLKFFFVFLLTSTTLCSDRLDMHVQNQMKLGEDLSSPSMKRVYEIYSKATGNRVQIRGRRVDANGVSGNKYAKLEISSISFGGRITIRSVATGRYLCMSRRGKLMGKMKRINSRCRFTERIGENYFDTFTNVRHPKWLMAFQLNGRPKRGPRTSRGQIEVMFLKRPLEQDMVTSTPSPSAVKQKTWSDLEKRIRMQYIAKRNVDISKSESSSSPSMMKDDPQAPTITNPPEIQEEIDLRREIALKIDSSESTLSHSKSDVTEASTLSSTKASQEKRNKDSRSKKKRNKKQKNKKRNRKHKNKSGKPTKNLLTKDFDIHSTSRKRHKQRKSSSSSVTALSSRNAARNTSSTVPSLLQVLGAKPSRSHKRSKRTKTKKSKKSRRRNSSRRRNVTQANT